MRRAAILPQATSRIFRWPIVMALANALGLAAALVGDGWYDLVSWATLGLTLVVMAVAWRRGTAVSKSPISPA